MNPGKMLMLFLAAAVAEIAGCYLTFSFFQNGKSWWILIPALAILFLFAWLLSLHEGPAGRTYAAYGGIYVAVAIIWMWRIEGISPDRWDLTGGVVTLIGMGIIAFGPR